MEDGYYLSTYIHIDEISHLYKLHIRHDQNISLWKKSGDNIQLVHLWELERITGIKRNNISFYSLEQARDFINKLLSDYGLSIKDMCQIIGTPELDTCGDYHSLNDYEDVSYHSICHLFSSILLDTELFYNNDIIGLAIDGGPDTVVDKNAHSKNYYCRCVWKNGELKISKAFSPGFLWMYVKKRTGLREGSLMALATASSSRLLYDEDTIIKVYGRDDLKDAYKLVSYLFDKVEKLTLQDKGILFNGFDDRFSEEDNRISMVVKVIQEMSVKIVDYNIQEMISQDNIIPENTYIAMSGGYGLNCHTNSHIMNKYGFKGFSAPPCVNDAGISIGMGLYYFYKNMERLNFKLATSYYGSSYKNEEEFLGCEGYKEFVSNISALDRNMFVKDIEEEPVIWFDGRAEIGPRALGHRSLLGNPCSVKTKEALNNIKKRQWWRPVAPIILYDRLDEWFEKGFYSPFMLHTLYIKEGMKDKVPAICHLDNSARVQTLEPSDNPVLYDLINCFYSIKGIPIICNTSLNDIGEPIIDNIEQCLNFALRKKIKIVYINGKRLELKNHQLYNEEEPKKRPYEIDFMSLEEKEDLKKKLNPYNLKKSELIFRYIRPDLGASTDIATREGADMVTRFAKFSVDRMGNVPICGI